VGDERSWGDGRGDPGRGRRPRPGEPATAALTVEQLVARQGGATGRRAARRAGAPGAPDPAERDEAAPAAAPSRPAPPRPAAGPAGLPPGHPSAPLPPLPPAATPRLSRPVPPLPGSPSGRAPAPPGTRPGSPGGGARPSTPVPPLPGRHPAAGARGSRHPGRTVRRATATPGRRRLVRVLGALAALVGLFLMYELGLYFYVDRSIGRVDALATDGPEVLAPQLQVGDDTYLVVGTHLPGASGTGAVTVLLASVSAAADRAVLLDVPPATLLDTPECRTSAGAVREPRTETLASALLDGGPSCVVRAVQELSGLRVDHFLDVDLSRLPAMVDALGGVPVCVQPSSAVSAAAGPLPVGSTSVTGGQAAAYLRPGSAAADPTGTAAGERAQLLLTSTLRAAMAGSTLTSPVTLTRFLTRASGALTTDRSTTLGDLRDLAGTLGTLSGGAVQRADLPVAQAGYVPAAGGGPAVLLDSAATRTLFDSVIGHTRLPAQSAAPAAAAPADGGNAGAGEGDAAPAAAPVPTAAGVTVDVLNGTGRAGLAASAADQLRGQGFTVGTVGNARSQVAQTVVHYAPAAQDQARTLASAVPGATLQADPSVSGVQLVIGTGWTGVVAPAPAPATAAPPAAAASAAVAAATAAAPVRC
jgi:LCP family protein required for cell wall assembly